MTLDVLYMVKFDCDCGASYLVGMREGVSERSLIGLYDWPLVPATPTDGSAIAECGICGKDLLRDYLRVTPAETLEIEVDGSDVCGDCGGTGMVSCQECDGEGNAPGGGRCEACDGKTGLVSCDPCGGSGEVPDEAATASAMAAALVGRRAFLDPDISGEGVVAAERWDSLSELAELAAGRGSWTK